MIIIIIIIVIIYYHSCYYYYYFSDEQIGHGEDVEQLRFLARSAGIAENIADLIESMSPGHPAQVEALPEIKPILPDCSNFKVLEEL